jgi:hypothetical protein
MATKKEKRATALAKRETFLADERARGLAALERDRAVRIAHEEELRREAVEYNRHLNNILATALLRDSLR